MELVKRKPHYLSVSLTKYNGFINGKGREKKEPDLVLKVRPS